MSQAEANKVQRVLVAAKPLKYTVQVHSPDGKVLEFQSNTLPVVQWNDSDRAVWVMQSPEGSYEKAPVTRFHDGDVILTEKNPD